MAENTTSITIGHLQRINAERMRRWHGESDWTPMQWSGAMAGEGGEMMEEVLGLSLLALTIGTKIGEAANAAKKYDRIVGQIAHQDNRLFGQRLTLPEQLEQYRTKIGKEVADSILYGILLCNCININLEDAIREVFNKKSEEYGFPERI